MALSPGTRIGPYEILSAIGAGGMGEVFRVRDTKLNRIVAIKAMHDAGLDEPERITRFEREAQLLASLNQPNIATIHGVEESEGATYLVLEFIDGRPLSDLTKDGPLPGEKRFASQKGLPTRSRPRTSAASSTATSNPVTS